MPSTLAQFEARVAQFLMDVGAAVFPTALLDESLRLALHEYTLANPLGKESVLTCPAAGREIALASLGDVLAVGEVWWPYDSDAVDETWPPNRVEGFRLWFDDASPVLHLDADAGPQPQLGDEIRIWWSTLHTIQNLDAADATTVRPVDESLLVLGAAGHACFARSVDVSETSGTMAVSTPNLAALGTRYLKEFRYLLSQIRAQGPSARGGRAFGAGWKLDEWDGV